MKCPKCQFENRSDVSFCEECGAKLELACPSCAAAIPLGRKFCGKCGHDLTTSREKPQVDLSFEEKLEQIQRYLPDGLTEKILAQRGKIEGERKQVTVMFCDAEGFSQISEKLGPEKVYSIMDEVFETLIHRVHEYGGTVNKMTGDGIMALFGAPIALEDAPQRAIRSALSIQREIARFSDRAKAETGMTPIRMRIGIHTGPVVVGSLGNDLRVEFTAVGDTVNLASRMEGLAEPGTVYVTEDTFKLTEGLFRFEALGEVQVKGKETPVKAYRVIAPSTRRTRFDVSAERGLTPFLGRERELELLLDGLDRARSGRGQAFSIMGEAGVGKSRLLYEFRKAIANEDITLIEGRCLSYSTNVAYHPVMDLLQSTYDIREGDTEDRITEKVKRGIKEIGVDEASTLPFILELLAVKDSVIDDLGLSPEVRKERTLDALKRIVLKGSETRPLVIAVEDLHWVDKSSEDTLKSLLDAISGAQVLLIFTYRPEFVHTWGTKSYHSQVNLMRLSNRETLAMAGYILGTEVIGDDLEELILEKTEGIPFFVEEFMKSLKDLGMIEWKDSGYYLAKDIKDLTIPSTIQDVIMARVDALPEGAKNVLQTGSAIGREFSCELIKRVTGVPQPEITSHLSALRDSELLYERGIFPQATYVFRHSLTQEVAYDSLLQKRKHEIHERIGQAIEELNAGRLDEFYEVLAHHYSRSEDSEKAYHYLKLSGDKAFHNYAVRETVRFYREAIEVLMKLPDTMENKRRGIEVRLLMHSPLSKLSYPEGSLEILQEGLRISEDLRDEKSLARFYSNIGLYHSAQGDHLRGISYTEDAFKEAEKTGDITLIAPIAFDLCASHIFAGKFPKVVDLAPAVIELLKKERREYDSFGRGLNPYSVLLSSYGMAMALTGDFEQGQVLCEKGLSFALSMEDLYSAGVAEVIYSLVFGIRGDGKSTVEHSQTAIRYCEQTEFAAVAGLAWSLLGIGYYYQGETERASKNCEKGIEIHRGSGLRAMLSLQYWLQSMAHLDAGDLKSARSSVEESLRLAQENNEKQNEGMSMVLLGKILAKSDPAQSLESEENIIQGIKILDELKLKPFLSIGYLYLGEFYTETGRNDKALEALRKAEAEFTEMGMDYWLRRTQEVLARMT